MKVLRTICRHRETLYDGIYSEKLDQDFEISGLEDIHFNVKELKGLRLSKILSYLTEKDKKYILNQNFLNTPPQSHLRISQKIIPKSEYYRYDCHLPIECLIKDKYLLLLTYGEKQPSRWILILEGIWEIEATEEEKMHLEI